MQTALPYLLTKPIIGIYEQILIMYSIDKKIIFTKCRKGFPDSKQIVFNQSCLFDI